MTTTDTTANAIIASDVRPTAVDDLSGHYVIDASHSNIGWTARHALVTTVRGNFKEFEGSADLDGADPANSSARVTIQAASLDTGQQQRDAHLRSPDFFDVENHPEITFVSTSAQQLDDETYRLAGDLTIRGISKPVAVDFTFNGTAKDPYGNIRGGFEGAVTVNRKDWGLNWNAALETGGFLVSDKVKLVFDLSVVKAATAA